ncbi:MAG: C-terminal binding protein [Thermomicrobiales bacterium]
MAEKPKYTVAFTSDRYTLDWESDAIASLTDLDIDVLTRKCATEDEIVELARDADALVVSTRHPITRSVLEQLGRCRVVGSYGVGLDHLDLLAAADLGVVVTHYPQYCTNEVADHAFSLILALNRRIHELDQDLRKGAWNHAGTRQMLRGPVAPLREQTLGIVGLGRIGTKVAERARPFGLTVIAADPQLDAETAKARGAELVTFDELLQRSDVITIHCPLGPQTQGLFDAAAFARMKPTAFLVNTARGPIVDLDAAIDALQHFAVAGAALDVVYPEPLPADSPLYQLPNVILTPHSAYYSERSVELVRSETLHDTLNVLRGIRPRTVANPEVLDRVSLAPPVE